MVTRGRSNCDGRRQHVHRSIESRQPDRARFSQDINAVGDASLFDQPQRVRPARRRHRVRPQRRSGDVQAVDLRRDVVSGVGGDTRYVGDDIDLEHIYGWAKPVFTYLLTYKITNQLTRSTAIRMICVVNCDIQ